MDFTDFGTNGLRIEGKFLKLLFFSRIVKYTFFPEFDQQINTEAHCILVCEQSNGLAVRDARQVVSVDLNRKFKDFFAKLKSSF